MATCSKCGDIVERMPSRGAMGYSCFNCKRERKQIAARKQHAQLRAQRMLFPKEKGGDAL